MHPVGSVTLLGPDFHRSFQEGKSEYFLVPADRLFEGGSADSNAICDRGMLL
jgi:hypothetical protein